MIIDGNSLINRAFYALPDLTNKEGVHTNAVFGFMNMLHKILDDYKPDYISVAFDMKKPTFRHKEFEDYKAHRKKMPLELSEQIPILKEILDAHNIHRIEQPGFEADDLIGTLAKYCEDQGMSVIIVTGDKDALQLVTDNIKVLITRKGITNLEIFNRERVFEVYGISPIQIIDFKGLVGDKSDNIPGVPGIGEKTATKLLQEFKNMENIINNVDELSSKSIRDKIVNNAEVAYLSKRLATIETNVPLEIDIEELRFEKPDYEKLLELYSKYEFNSLIKRMIPEMDKERPLEMDKDSGNIKIIDSEEDAKKLIKVIYDKKGFGLKIFKEEENNIRVDSILGISIITDKHSSYFVNIKKSNKLLNTFKDVFEDSSILKYGHELKRDIIALLRYNIRLRGVAFDSFIAAYLLDPSKSSYDVADLALDYLGKSIKSLEEFFGKGKSYKCCKDIPLVDLIEYGRDYCKTVYDVKNKLLDKLQELELYKLFNEIEMPLVEVLANMEYEGIKVDKDVLKSLDEEFTVKIEEVTKKIYELAGEEFNINSPKQLGVILFEKLKLPVIKKTKTGYSTGHDILEKLEKQHPIISLIIEYRQLVKIKTTYVDSLFNLINPETGKIHSSFNQTVTVTGRISSTEPNMQNIPIKYEIGRRIRKIFVPSNKNYKLLDADYSQIELRVLAHMSKDENLIEAFNNNLDIHTITASQVFNIPVEKVTSLERGRAKAVNFGIVYGISDYGLSENLNITRKEAKKYIEQYFNKYKGVKKYMDDSIKKGKELGYVTTIFNRRRYIPEIKSRNYNLRSFGERTAMNTPIQGSAADIIKIAMIKVYNELIERNLKSKLILQVHDELIIDTCIEELETVKEILRNNMESAIKLSVPLIVDMNIGDSWYDTK